MTLQPKSRGQLLCRHAFAALVLLFDMGSQHIRGQEALSPQAGRSALAAGPRYDVVSIVPNKLDSDNSGIQTRDGTFSAENVSLKSLLSGAYSIRQGLISGVPGWAETARFNINAKIVEPDIAVLKKLKKEQRAAMLAAILEDRFQVKTHIEAKLMPVYDLVIAKNGSKLKETPRPPRPSDGNPPPEKGAGGGYSASDTNMTAQALQISSLADWLSGQLNRTVIDKTELTGEYDFQINFSADAAELSGVDDGRSKADQTAPSLFTALQDQLGLKLESTKGPVETLVVDHAELPSAN